MDNLEIIEKAINISERFYASKELLEGLKDLRLKVLLKQAHDITKRVLITGYSQVGGQLNIEVNSITDLTKQDKFLLNGMPVLMITCDKSKEHTYKIRFDSTERFPSSLIVDDSTQWGK